METSFANETNVLMVCGSMPRTIPYLQSYIDMLNRNGVRFCYLCWNREEDIIIEQPSNMVVYKKKAPIHHANWKKVIEEYRFSLFVKKHLRNKHYKTIIVFGIVEAIFLNAFLQKYYNKQYIFDIRDYSPILKFAWARARVERLIEHSAFTVLSSAGFKEWLPNKPTYKYVITHNTNMEMLNKYINFTTS